MAIIPQYQQQVATKGETAKLSGQNYIAGALQDLGGSIGKVGGVMAQFAEKQENTDNYLAKQRLDNLTSSFQMMAKPLMEAGKWDELNTLKDEFSENVKNDQIINKASGKIKPALEQQHNYFVTEGYNSMVNAGKTALSIKETDNNFKSELNYSSNTGNWSGYFATLEAGLQNGIITQAEYDNKKRDGLFGQSQWNDAVASQGVEESLITGDVKKAREQLPKFSSTVSAKKAEIKILDYENKLAIADTWTQVDSKFKEAYQLGDSPEADAKFKEANDLAMTLTSRGETQYSITQKLTASMDSSYFGDIKNASSKLELKAVKERLNTRKGMLSSEVYNNINSTILAKESDIESRALMAVQNLVKEAFSGNDITAQLTQLAPALQDALGDDVVATLSDISARGIVQKGIPVDKEGKIVAKGLQEQRASGLDYLADHNRQLAKQIKRITGYGYDPQKMPEIVSSLLQQNIEPDEKLALLDYVVTQNAPKTGDIIQQKLFPNTYTSKQNKGLFDKFVSTYDGASLTTGSFEHWKNFTAEWADIFNYSKGHTFDETQQYMETKRKVIVDKANYMQAFYQNHLNLTSAKMLKNPTKGK